MGEADDSTLVIAFGGIGAFSPPMAFYLACVRTARDVLGVGRVLLAFEGRSNPSVTAVEMALRARGIPVWCRPVEAAAWPDAVHLVASGLVDHSPRRRSLFSFRSIALRPDGDRQAAIRLFIGTSTGTGTGYPRAADWDGSPAQRTAMLAYAEGDIAVTEVPASFAADAALFADPDGPARLAVAYAALYPDDVLLPVLQALLAAVLDPSVPMPDLPTDTQTDAFIPQNIAQVRAIRRGAAPRQMIDIDQICDFLATSCNIADWSLLWRINLLAMRQIRATRTVAVMVTMRDEGISILEWVAHHLAIGVEGIFIYTNDNSDGSDTLLARLAAHGLITLVQQQSALGTYVQRKSLQHAVHFLPELRDFEWVLFVDADELTIPAARYDYKIKNLIARAEQAPRAGGVLLPWQWRVWPHRFHRQPGMVLARFAHAEPHTLFKTLVRLRDALGMCGVHAPALDAGRILVDSNIDEIGSDQLWDDRFKSNLGGWIEHYWGRSFVEFIVKKRRSVALQIPTDDFNRADALFETWNRPTTQENLHPVASIVVARTRAMMERMLDQADIAAAVDGIEAQFSARAAAIAADPTMRAVFAGMIDPNNPLHWTAENVAQTAAILRQPGGVTRLAEAMSQRFPNGPHRFAIRAVLQAILDPTIALPTVAADDPEAALWRVAITESRSLRLGATAAWVRRLGPDYDFIAASGAPSSWGLWQWLGVLAMRQIAPRNAVAAMVSARNEGINLLEWVAHCQAIGVERIFVYTNANDDGSDELLTALAEHGIITLVIQDCGPGIWAQCRAQQHALLMLPEMHDYRWVLFVDADEYLVPDAVHDHGIAPLLAAADALVACPGAVLLPWRARHWPHRLDRPPGMTLANYPHAAAHELFKCAVRPATATSMAPIHAPILDPGVPMVDGALADVPVDAHWPTTPKPDVGGRVEHIWARSFIDFVIKRQRDFTGEFRDFDLFHRYNQAMTAENFRPIEPVVIERTRRQLDLLRAIPDIAAAAALVEAIYATRAAEIAADPELRAIFAAQPDLNGAPIP